MLGQGMGPGTWDGIWVWHKSKGLDITLTLPKNVLLGNYLLENMVGCFQIDGSLLRNYKKCHKRCWFQIWVLSEFDHDLTYPPFYKLPQTLQSLSCCLGLLCVWHHQKKVGLHCKFYQHGHNILISKGVYDILIYNGRSHIYIYKKVALHYNSYKGGSTM